MLMGEYSLSLELQKSPVWQLLCLNVSSELPDKVRGWGLLEKIKPSGRDLTVGLMALEKKLKAVPKAFLSHEDCL